MQQAIDEYDAWIARRTDRSLLYIMIGMLLMLVITKLRDAWSLSQRS